MFRCWVILRGLLRLKPYCYYLRWRVYIIYDWWFAPIGQPTAVVSVRICFWPSEYNCLAERRDSLVCVMRSCDWLFVRVWVRLLVYGVCFHTREPVIVVSTVQWVGTAFNFYLRHRSFINTAHIHSTPTQCTIHFVSSRTTQDLITSNHTHHTRSDWNW